MRSCAVFFALLTISAVSVAKESPRYFFYLSDKRIVTVEVSSDRKAILNYINISENIEVIEAANLLVLDADGNRFQGHLFANEGTNREEEPFLSSHLLKPGEFGGYDVLGSFRLKAAPRAVYFKIASRLFSLDPLNDEDFDLVEARIAEIDLSVGGGLAVRDVGFRQGYGSSVILGTAEAAEIEAQIKSTDPLPPVVLSNPPPRLNPKWNSLPEPVLVTVRVKVTEKGGLTDLEIAKGVNPELDKQALEVVRNSWSILPAVSKGKPAASVLVLRVFFVR